MNVVYASKAVKEFYNFIRNFYKKLLFYLVMELITKTKSGRKDSDEVWGFQFYINKLFKEDVNRIHHDKSEEASM